MSRRCLLFLLPFFLGAVPASAMEPVELLPPGGALSPLVAVDAPETYTPESLWEKIDGEAELYRRFHLVSTAYRRYSLPDDPDETLEIGVHRLASPLHAFGLFAFFRAEGASPLPYGNGAVRDGSQGFMRHGPFFVSVDAFLDEDLLSRLVPEALRLVADRIGEVPPEIPALAAVREIFGNGVMRYLPDHALGRRIFPPGLEFSPDPERTFFVSTVPPGGGTALEEYAAGLEDARKEKIDGIIYLDGRDPALGSITLALHGNRLAGVKAVPASGENRRILRDLLDALTP